MAEFAPTLNEPLRESEGRMGRLLPMANSTAARNSQLGTASRCSRLDRSISMFGSAAAMVKVFEYPMKMSSELNATCP